MQKWIVVLVFVLVASESFAITRLLRHAGRRAVQTVSVSSADFKIQGLEGWAEFFRIARASEGRVDPKESLQKLVDQAVELSQAPPKMGTLRRQVEAHIAGQASALHMGGAIVGAFLDPSVPLSKEGRRNLLNPLILLGAAREYSIMGLEAYFGGRRYLRDWVSFQNGLGGLHEIAMILGRETGGRPDPELVEVIGYGFERIVLDVNRKFFFNRGDSSLFLRDAFEAAPVKEWTHEEVVRLSRDPFTTIGRHWVSPRYFDDPPNTFAAYMIVCLRAILGGQELNSEVIRSGMREFAEIARSP